MKPVTDPALLAQLNASDSGGAPAPAGGGMRPVTDPALLAALNAGGSGVAGPAAPYKATDDMGTVARLLAGAGHGMDSVVTGTGQSIMHALGATHIIDPRLVDLEDKNISRDAALYNNDLGQTPAGIGGSILGNAALTLPLGRARFASGPGMLASTVNAGVQGAVANMLNPVEDVQQPLSVADLVAGKKPEGEGFLAGKLKQEGLGALFGAGGNALLHGAGSAIEKLIPGNSIKELFNRGLGTADPGVLKAGEEAANATGVRLSPGMMSANPDLVAMENTARQSLGSRDLMQQFDRSNTQALSDHMDKLIGGITSQESSPAIAGAKIQDTVKKMLTDLEGWRSKTANEDYGKVRALSAQATGPMEFPSTRAALETLLAKHEGANTGPSNAIAKFARGHLNNVSPEGAGALTDTDKQIMAQLGMDKFSPKDLANTNPLALTMMETAAPGITDRLQQAALPAMGPARGNLDNLMRLRSTLSEVSAGKSSIGGKGEDRHIAANLLKTIDQDIEDAGGKIGGDLGGALKTANARYREVSQQMDSVKNSPLGKILGKDVAGAFQSGDFNTVAPEKVMDTMRALKPTEIGVVRGMLEKDNPDAWAAFKSHYLEHALENAKQMPASDGVNKLVLRPNVLAKNLADRRKLEAIFEPDELKKIEYAVEVSKRISDKTGYNFSGTDARAEARQTMGGPLAALLALKTGGMSHIATSLASDAATKKLGSIGASTVARIALDSNGRADLIRLSRLPPESAQARELATKLVSLYQRAGPEKPDDAKASQ